jgi:hypothetical protein
LPHLAIQPELISLRRVSLDGLTPDVAIDLLRSVQEYGPAVGKERGLPADYPETIQSAAAAVVRFAIAESFPSAHASQPKHDVTLARQEDTDTLYTIEERELYEEEEFRKALPISSQLTPRQLAFMTRCVLRSGSGATDDAERAQANHTLAWLASNKSTRRIVERVAGVEQRREHVGRSAWRAVRAIAANL